MLIFTYLCRRVNVNTTNILDVMRIQARNVVISHLKLMTELRSYFLKLADDKAYESVFNKHFALFLQKLNPVVYSSEFVRRFSSDTTTTAYKKEDVNRSMLNSIKIVEKKVVIPSWKQSDQETISTNSEQIVLSLSAIEKQTSETIKLLKVESLIAHLKRYPEAKHTIVKAGVIRLLLRIRENANSEELFGALNEAFALLGHASPVSGNGIRILSIDGGGVRGMLVIEMLRKLEEISGKRIYEMFDFICGVSTGAIIATLLGLKQLNLNEISHTYRSIGQQIFTQSTLKGTSNLVWSHSYYDTALWEKLLKAQWDNKTLIETKRNIKTPYFCAVSAVVNQSCVSAYVFRNYELPWRVQSQYMGGSSHCVWEAVRASAAAPTYFEEFKIGNMLHQDGGILVNNPTAIAIHEAKLLWPRTPIQCVVSFGTGRTAPNPIESCRTSSTTQISNSSWKRKFFAIIDSATDTEGVHTMLSDLLPSNAYYRFNPYLTEMLDISEIDPIKLEQLQRDAIMYLRRNEDKFHDAVRALSKKKTSTQKIADWLSLQVEKQGLRQN